ncbi:sialic acid-binding Ig-like lectin 5 isoform X1 [Huso huso]|uniref:Sialic acid-binding Ig-like lectin 5 isoform X1 n=1 Tax=Huso huso TaxID=61971 RepID=A0ABR0YBF8_HUSHU
MKLVLAAFLQWVLFEGLLRESVCTEWTAQLPETISAVEGSCVVIPCAFTYPKGVEASITAVWYTSRRIFQSLVVYNGEDPLKVDARFLGRAFLIGNLTSGDCALKIDKVKTTDGQHYYVSFHAKGQKFRFQDQKVTLSVSKTPEKPRITNPGLLTEGRPVTVNCTTEYTCPSNPPTVDWGGVNGTVILQYTAKQQVAWAATSSITFTPSYRDSQIQCQVKYPGRNNVTEHRPIHVKYAPKDTEILVWTRNIKEGSSVSMSCSSKGDPPISRYSWFLVQGGQEVDLEQHTEKVRVPNVTRGVQFYCTAENKIGQTQSPRKSLNVEYKPDITGESKCTFSPGEMVCHCLVNSNPPAQIQWIVNSSAQDFNLSTWSSGEWVTSVLTGALQVQTNVSCTAFNKHGETVYVLPFHVKESLLWMIVPAVGGLACLLFILLIAITVFCCRKRRGRHFIHQPRMYSLCDTSIYQESSPLYMNCTEANPIYTNGSYQILYENCTPSFVRTQQHRAAWRRREVREDNGSATECPVYLEVL